METLDNNLQITFCSGVGSVTGANFLLESKKVKILIDCGLIQGKPDSYAENIEDFLYDPKSIDFLFITHAHMDHIGRVGKLVKEGFKGVIYSTSETRELASVMIQDAIKVMNMKREGINLESKEEPLYDTPDFNRAMELWKTISYHKDIKINEEFSVYLKDAGHILGSAMYEFTFNLDGKNKKIVFTGDSGNSPTPLLEDTEKITDADYLILDSVYGDRNHESKEERDEKFKQVVIDTVKKGGTLVIPAFSVERTQVILYELNNLIESNLVPSVPVFLDSPLAIKVTEIYKHSSRLFNDAVKKEISSGDNIFNFPKLTVIHGREESENIIRTGGAKIIIAGSGMSSGGRVVAHEMHYLPDPNSTLLLMGYQALGTLGRKISEKPRQVEINGNLIPINARIESISGYSSHRDSDGLVSLVEGTASTVKKVFVVLGEPKSSMYLVQRLRDELEVDAVYPEHGVSYKLV